MTGSIVVIGTRVVVVGAAGDDEGDDVDDVDSTELDATAVAGGSEEAAAGRSSPPAAVQPLASSAAARPRRARCTYPSSRVSPAGCLSAILAS